MYVSKEMKGVTFQHSFGGRVKMQLGVDLKCCSRNTDTCKMCGKKPTGDYWHLNNKIFLCRMCMTREFQEQVKFKKRELELFRVKFQYFKYKYNINNAFVIIHNCLIIENKRLLGYSHS